jgi:ferredoxin
MDRRTLVGSTAADAMSSPLPRIAFSQTAPKAKNIVLVRGLFADGSSWSKVIPRSDEAQREQVLRASAGCPVQAISVDEGQRQRRSSAVR